MQLTGQEEITLTLTRSDIGELLSRGSVADLLSPGPVRSVAVTGKLEAAIQRHNRWVQEQDELGR